jgi:prolyl-tRNA editing enzyme YbaK/EbsC (Cys-tRNA(Pro) deacylase)
MKEASERVAQALRAAGVDAEVVVFAESTRTADEAAAAVSSKVGQIVKSLVFLAGDRPVLALVSGSNRVDTAKLAAVAGGEVKRASAEIVREATGYAIGGVPPIGLASPLPVYLDRDLLQYGEVWAAAGTPNAVFKIDPATLRQITAATVSDLAQASPA